VDTGKRDAKEYKVANSIRLYNFWDFT